ncbi:MAG TPA: hypothetical protein VIU02_02185 [Burkholderiales bacterium]
MTAWLCERFGVGKQLDWPAAPIALRGEGEDPGRSYWMCASPIHLRVQRDQLVLLPPASLSVTQAESHTLVENLNRHFSVDGLLFQAPHPQRWYLRLSDFPDLQTVALEEAVGRDINRLLPSGADRMRFHHLFNEIQMLLHDHPVNEAREDAGSLPINSVWFWEGGTLPPASRASWAAAIGDLPLLQGLGRLASVPVACLSDGLVFPGTGNTLVVLPELAGSDDTEWAGHMTRLDNEWILPLLAKLRSGEIQGMDVFTVHAGQARQWTVAPRDLWKFWKPVAPLARHFEASGR